jgi:hypothetical protein
MSTVYRECWSCWHVGSVCGLRFVSNSNVSVDVKWAYKYANILGRGAHLLVNLLKISLSFRIDKFGTDSGHQKFCGVRDKPSLESSVM